MEVLISLMVAVSIYLILYILLSTHGPVKVRDRISKYFKENNVNDVQEQFIREKNEEENKRKKERFKIASKEFSNYIASSGIKLRANEFIYFWAGLTLVPMMVVLLFSGNIITGAALSIIGISIPPFIVSNARKKREELFNKQLGDATVIMGNSIKGGFTFLQSMENIAEEMQPPISNEFAKVLREIHYGVKQEDALNHMVERTKNKDLELLISAVMTSAQVGSNLSDILDTISSTIRDRIRIKNEIKTLTAQGRMSGLVIGLLPIVLILAIMVMTPSYFEGFFESNMGKILIIISIVLEITGFAIINKIVNIKM
ncbi:MAG: type II secretion system F family protein [Bacteroidales bacterium]|nr:type II secretion system F family protein [Bacteroidales bacterium]